MKPGESILACFALKEEAAPFRKPATDLPKVEVLITGMGKRNAARSLRSFLEGRRPDHVLSCGFAGGLNPALKTGTVVFAADNDSGLETALSNAGAQRVRFHCADSVAATAAEKQAVWKSTGAEAVEMESQALGAVCDESGIPFSVVRVILDTAAEDLPLDFNRLMTPDMRMDYARLAVAIVKSPGKIGALLKLQKQGQAAAASLAKVLVTLLDR